MKAAASAPAPAAHVPVPQAMAQADLRPATMAQRQAQADIDGSPRQVTQRQALAAIDGSPRQVAQRQQAAAATPPPRKNTTGLPDQLKAGVEHLSGHSLDDVRVHYNSARPAQLQAHAYAQGSAIHVAPGQEQHLPHEAWHVAQQKQGRVTPTMQLKGVGVNDNQALELEATQMGQQALAVRPATIFTARAPVSPMTTAAVPVQRFFDDEKDISPGGLAARAGDKELTPDQTAVLEAARLLPRRVGMLADYLGAPETIPDTVEALIQRLDSSDDAEMHETPQLEGPETAPAVAAPGENAEMQNAENQQAEGDTSLATARKRRPSNTGLERERESTETLPGLNDGKRQKSQYSGLSLHHSISPSEEDQASKKQYEEEQAQQEQARQWQVQQEQERQWRARQEQARQEQAQRRQARLQHEQEQVREETDEKEGYRPPAAAAANPATTVWGNNDQDMQGNEEPEQQGLVQHPEANQAEAQEEGQLNEDLTDDEAEAEAEAFAARELQLISFGEGDVQVLTEKFQHKAVDRRRPVEWKIPFKKWGGGAQGKGRSTPRPMSLHSAPDAGKVVPDQDYDEEGQYQYGHMVPASSGAHNHYALTTPMEQHTNQFGAWRKVEEAIDRILLKPNRANQTARPKDGKEEELALIIQGYYNKNTTAKGRGFVHITAQYNGPDGRIPSGYDVILVGVNLDDEKEQEAVVLHNFGHIENKYSAEDRDKKPSPNLIALFKQVDDKMQALDQQADKESKETKEDENTKRHKDDKQWTPLPPEEDSSGAMHPARGIPEQHVPRPHRALDVLVKELKGMGDTQYQQVLDGLTEDERQAVDTAVYGTDYGAVQPFNWAQRDLAERHARHLDPEGLNQFPSDTREAVIDKLKGLTPADKAMYTDKYSMLKHGGGNARPEADHHVPRSTGAGTNYFSNLLWVSHTQNTGKAQTKSVDLLNPNRLPPLNDSFVYAAASVPDGTGAAQPGTRRGKTAEHELATVAKGGSDPETMTEAAWDAWQAEIDTENAREPEAGELKKWADDSYESLRKDADEDAAEKTRGSLAKNKYKELLAKENVRDGSRGIMPWDITALAVEAKMKAVPVQK